MKANELRIGNLVNEFGLPTKITGRILEKIESANERNKIIIDFSYIPLTEEWLLKAGCSDKNHYTLDLKAKRKTIVFNWLSKVVATGKRSGFHSKKYRHLKYVHQLQNLYFALCGEELVFSSTEP